jgi:cell division septation protein DedD
MAMRTTLITLNLALLLLIAGCASTGSKGDPPKEPQPVPPTETPEPRDTPEDPPDPADPTQPAMTPTEQPVPDTSAQEGTAGEENRFPDPEPTDELDLPGDAMPVPPDSLRGTGLSAAAPAEPPLLEDGWMVQILALTDRKAVNSAYTNLKIRLSEMPLHLRFVQDRYILLAGGYAERAPADSLRGLLIAEGYEDAFVVEAPVVADSAGAGEQKQAEQAQTSGQGAGEDEQKPAATAEGYRVQIMSLGSRTAAEQQARMAERRTGKPVYVEQVDGVYKLRLGDFTGREQAGLEADRIESLGYEGAFVVSSTVNVSTADASK